MGPIVIIVVIALLGWLALVAAGSLKRQCVGWLWWAALVGCLVVGFSLGVWFGLFFEYRPEPKLRVVGFPLPSVCFVQETDANGVERWIDYPSLLGLVDVLLFSFASVYIVWLVNSLWRLASDRRRAEQT